MPSFECIKCIPVDIPDDWTAQKKGEVADWIRRTSPIQAIQHFRPIGMSLADAKGIALHVTKEKGNCHNCRTELFDYEGQCSKCKRLNLDW